MEKKLNELIYILQDIYGLSKRGIINLSDFDAHFNDLYFKNFTDQKFEPINRMLASAAIRGLGYNNYHSSLATGERHFIEKILAEWKPKVCIDIGANIGEYSRLLLEETAAKVISFEPLEEPFMEMYGALNKYSERFIGVNSAVGRKNERANIFYNSETTAFASLSAEINQISYLNNNSVVDVNVVTLDSYLEDNNINSVDLIKIDVEGFEAEVLVGAKNTIKYLRPKFIQIEFNLHQLIRGHSIFSYANLLEAYDPYQLLPTSWAYRDLLDPYANIYCFSNYVFVRRD